VEIITKLDKLVLTDKFLLKNKARRSMKTFEQHLKGGWNSSDIADLVTRLRELRKAVETNLLFSIK